MQHNEDLGVIFMQQCSATCAKPKGVTLKVRLLRKAILDTSYYLKAVFLMSCELISNLQVPPILDLDETYLLKTKILYIFQGTDFLS